MSITTDWSADAVASLGLLAFVLGSCAAYGVRSLRHGRRRSSRVEREGDSLLVAKGAMETAMWVLEPLGASCARVGISANLVTGASLVLGFVSAALIAVGHFGWAAIVAACAAFGDALDGAVARASGMMSEEGAILDAATDRYVEFAMIGALAYFFRDRASLLLLALGALSGAFMVSYASAKAEGLRVSVPRGAMRRMERLFLLVIGIGFFPVLGSIPALARWSDAPIACALMLIAGVGNASAVRRLYAASEAVRERRERSSTLPQGVSAPAVERRVS